MINKSDIERLRDRGIPKGPYRDTYDTQDVHAHFLLWRDLAEALLKERDEALRLKEAYREVGMKFGHVCHGSECRPVCCMGAIFDVDVETVLKEKAE